MPNFPNQPPNDEKMSFVYKQWFNDIWDWLRKNQGRPTNFVINGCCEVAQRAVPNLSTTLQYGSVDRFKVGVTAGTVSAGTITQTTTSTAGRTGYALHVSGASLASTPTLTVDTYIEAKDAVLLKNTIASFGLVVYHDVGSSIVYTVSIDKATATDNFAGVTNISSISVNVATATATNINFLGISMGDCSNGIRIRVSTPPGTTTTKNFHYAEWQLVEGVILPTTYPYSPFEVELDKVLRYFYKSFPYTTAPAQNVGNVGAIFYRTQIAGTATGYVIPLRYPIPMRISPTVTYYSPGSATANWRNTTGAADSAVGQSVQASEVGNALYNPQVAGDAAGNYIGVHLIADADF